MTPMTTAVALTALQPDHCNVNNWLLGRNLDIQTLQATALDDPLAREEVVAAFALRIGECTGLLGATLGSITFNSLGNTDPRARWVKQGAAEVFMAQMPLQ
jgi:hypothetical protein